MQSADWKKKEKSVPRPAHPVLRPIFSYPTFMPSGVLRLFVGRNPDFDCSGDVRASALPAPPRMLDTDKVLLDRMAAARAGRTKARAAGPVAESKASAVSSTERIMFRLFVWKPECLSCIPSHSSKLVSSCNFYPVKQMATDCSGRVTTLTGICCLDSERVLGVVEV